MGSEGWRRKKSIYPILAIFIVSMVIRAVVLFQFRGTVYFSFPIVDSAFYHDSAVSFLAKGDFGSSLFLMSPVYQILISCLYSLAGVNLLAIYVAQILIGSLSAVLLYVLAEKLFNRTTALIAAALYLLYGGFSLYNMVLLPLTLIIFLNLSLILILLTAKERNSRSYFFVAGIIYAVSMMARPNILLFLIFLVPWFCIAFGSRRKGLLNLAPFILGSLIAILPFSMLHYRTDGEISPFASTMGINLYLGNNPDADGIQYIPSPELNSPEKIFDYARAVAESETGKTMKPHAVSDFWARRALKFIVSQPGNSVPLFWRKFSLFWNSHEVSNNYNYYFFRNQLPILRLLVVDFALIGTFAIVGMAANIRRLKNLFLLYGMVLTYNAALVAFFVLSRYRIAAVPFLILFAASGMYFAADRRKPIKAVLLAGAIVVIFLLLHVKIIEQDLSTAYVNQGILYRNEGSYQLAVQSLEKAIETDPGDATAYYNLAVVYLDLERNEQAEECLQEALELEPNYRKALNGLATVYTNSGNYREAEVLFRKILELNPRDVDALNNLGVLYGKTGEYERAELLFREALTIRPGNTAAMDNLKHLKELTR
jgi:Tfp pilus assembly protein PilF/4-amino-4-deoxy-L-arabinose transferase-like glycosyltransferase